SAASFARGGALFGGNSASSGVGWRRGLRVRGLRIGRRAGRRFRGRRWRSLRLRLLGREGLLGGSMRSVGLVQLLVVVVLVGVVFVVVERVVGVELDDLGRLRGRCARGSLCRHGLFAGRGGGRRGGG